MSRYIDADAVKEALKQNTPQYMWGEVLTTVNIQPYIELDLVTCAECRYCTLDIVVQRRTDGYEKTVNLCRNPKHFEEWSVPKDWYCADGERRESE